MYSKVLSTFISLVAFAIFASSAHALQPGKYKCEPKRNGKICKLKFPKKLPKSLRTLKHPTKNNLYYKPRGKVLKVRGNSAIVFYKLDEKYKVKKPATATGFAPEVGSYGSSFSHN